MAISYRAGTAAGPRPRPEARVDRGARPAAADLDHVAGGLHSQRRGPRRQARRDRRASPTRRPSSTRPCGTPASSPSSIRESDVGFRLVPAMLQGKVDATIGGFWNYEAVQLRMMHRHPTVIPVDRAGVPINQDLVLVVREEEARYRGAGSARVHAGAHARRAGGAREPGAGRRRGGAPRTRRSSRSSSSNRSADAAGVRPHRSRQAVRLAEPECVVLLRHLDVQGRPDQAQPRRLGLYPYTNEFLPGQGI